MPKFYCKVIPAASQVPLHLPFLAASNTLLCFVSFRFHFSFRSQFAQHAISDFYKSSPSSTIL